MKKISVIGGGPAGIMAAATAARCGNKVIIFEKNSDLGRKLLITGKGRCNITNSAPIEDFIKNVPVNGNFLYSAFYGFTNYDLINLLSELGLETKVERGGRVFPTSDKSRDVLSALKSLLKKYGVGVVHAEVEKIVPDGNGKIVRLRDGRSVRCDSVIIATGGASYPRTGSTGDGYRFARSFGHTVVAPKPSLVPIELKGTLVSKLMGLSLKNVAVEIRCGGKEIFSDFGEMIFTHFGASGPVVLSASSHIKQPENGGYTLRIDLKPALDEKTLDRRILRDFESLKNKDLINSLDALLPKKMIPVIVELSGLEPHRKINEITKAQRAKLVHAIKNLEFDIKGFRPIDEAIVTSGGVSVREINPSTMESKLVAGIFFAGEVIDVDAYTGGFNLQIAFSTGYAAGKNA